MSSTSTNCRPSKSSRPMFDGLESEGLVDPKALPESCPSLKSSLRAQLDEAIAGPLRSALGVPHTAQPPHLAQALWLAQVGARLSKFSSILWPSQHRDMVGPCTCFDFRGQGVPNGCTPWRGWRRLHGQFRCLRRALVWKSIAGVTFTNLHPIIVKMDGKSSQSCIIKAWITMTPAR